jgi:hypothetical protein
MRINGSSRYSTLFQTGSEMCVKLRRVLVGISNRVTGRLLLLDLWYPRQYKKGVLAMFFLFTVLTLHKHFPYTA